VGAKLAWSKPGQAENFAIIRRNRQAQFKEIFRLRKAGHLLEN